jgi:hypothetical protein
MFKLGMFAFLEGVKGRKEDGEEESSSWAVGARDQYHFNVSFPSGNTHR